MNLINRENRYEFELPKTKKKVKFKLLTHKDEQDTSIETQRYKDYKKVNQM